MEKQSEHDVSDEGSEVEIEGNLKLLFTGKCKCCSLTRLNALV